MSLYVLSSCIQLLHSLLFKGQLLFTVSMFKTTHMPSFQASGLCFTLFLLQKVAWGSSPAFPLCSRVFLLQVLKLCPFIFVHFCIFVLSILIKLFCLCIQLLTLVMELLIFLHHPKMCLELFQSSPVSRHRARS